MELTLEMAKALGFETIEAMQAEVAKAQAVAAGEDGLKEVTKELTTAVNAWTDATKAYTAAKEREIEEDRFNELCNERLLDVAKGLDENDPKRAELTKMFAGAYGEHAAELALEGSEYQKAISAPLTVRDSRYDEKIAVRKANDYMLILSAYNNGLFPGGGNDGINYDAKTLLQSARQLEKLGLEGADAVAKAITKAMDGINNNEGKEWMPSYMSASMWDDLYLQLKIASLFRRVDMPTKSFDYPIRLGRTRGYCVDEVSADTAVDSSTPFFSNKILASTMKTSKVTFSARKYGVASFLSDEIMEDAILPVLQMVREDILFGFADGIEDAVINGSSNTNDLDNAGTDTNRLWANTADQGDGIRLATGARDSRNLWAGLRSKFILQTGYAYVDGSTLNLDALRNARKLMGKYSVDTSNLVWIISPNTHVDILRFPEVVTVEKYGPGATVHTGEIGQIDGIPLIISPRIYTNLNAVGVFDNSVKTKTEMILVDMKGYAFGDRRLLRVESDRQALAGQRYVMGTWRGDFKKMFADGEPLTQIVRNLASQSCGLEKR